MNSTSSTCPLSTCVSICTFISKCGRDNDDHFKSGPQAEMHNMDIIYKYIYIIFENTYTYFISPPPPVHQRLSSLPVKRTFTLAQFPPRRFALGVASSCRLMELSSAPGIHPYTPSHSSVANPQLVRFNVPCFMPQKMPICCSHAGGQMKRMWLRVEGGLGVAWGPFIHIYPSFLPLH